MHTTDMLKLVESKEFWELFEGVVAAEPEMFFKHFEGGELQEYVDAHFTPDDIFSIDDIADCFTNNCYIGDYVDLDEMVRDCVTSNPPEDVYGAEYMCEYVMENYFENYKEIIISDIEHDVGEYITEEVLSDWAEENGWVKKDD